MVDESVVSDIRRLLKTFGVQADAAIIQHLRQHPEVKSLHLRISLEDLTDYPDIQIEPVALIVEGSVTREEQ